MSYYLTIALTASVIFCYKLLYVYWKNVDFGFPKLSSRAFKNNPLFNTKPFPILVQEIYKGFKQKGQKHGFFYRLVDKVYMPVDLDYAKRILTADFSYFADRGVYINEKYEPLSAHLFSMKQAKWRCTRASTTPAFTDLKMRVVLGSLIGFSNLLVTQISDFADHKKPFCGKDILTLYATDTSVAFIFGVDGRSIQNKGSEFVSSVRSIFDRSKLVTVLLYSFPKIGPLLGLRLIPRKVESFYMSIVKKIVDYREKKNIIQNDIIQTLIDLKNKNSTENLGIVTSVKDVAVTCFGMFLAGSEATATTLTFCLFEISKNRELQDKIRKELNVALENHNNVITYELLSEMVYLEQVIDETLRMYPPTYILVRQCVKDYLVPDTDLIIKRGTHCVIPLIAIHHDKEYYEEPKKFNPDRFSYVNKRQRHVFAFLPFGAGPRQCIGSKFGYFQIKVALISLLRKYRFTVDKRTKQPLEFNKTLFTLQPKGGIWLRAEHL